ncbi:MAG: hypothetical protein DBY35_09370 [Bacteroidales bacterium]|nr:MAG: hypothetical protein DBY35_09370 [Bacteroidales bacterium]
MKKFFMLKTTALFIPILFLSIAFSACKDDNLEFIQAEIELPDDANLMELEQWSYSIPFEIKSDSEWEIDFSFDDGKYICYAYPNKGVGNATVKICVLDNWTDYRRNGEMYITFPKDESKNQVIKLSQKCNLDNDENLTEIKDGDRIYAVGYGYNFLGEYASANSVSLNPIVMIDACSDRVNTGGVNASFEAKTYSGSSVTELMNELNADAKFEGKYFGFKGEVGATFGMRDFSNKNNEYAISYVEVAQQNIFLQMNRDEIIMDYMTDAAYEAINGLPHKGKRGEIPTSYPSTPEGLKKLVQDYGTHLILKARLGGKLKYRMTVDVSKVEGSYDLKAFANCSYKNSFIKTSASVSDSLHSSYNQNSKACEVKVFVQGGGKAEALKLGSNGGDNDANLKAWQTSLTDIKNQTLVGLDINDGMIPLYDLVNTNIEGGKARYNVLKAYITGDTEGLEAATSEALGLDLNYETGTVAHLKEIPIFDDSHASNSLIKDVYIQGQNVARVCEEFIPVIDKTKRVTVIYPVVSNKVKYNMGYFVGDAKHKPAKVCWDGMSLSVVECKDQPIGKKKELYIRGAAFMDSNKGDEQLESTVSEYKWSAPGYNGSYKYSLVKIFNKIWMRENYKGNRKEDGDKFGNNYNLEPVWASWNGSSQCYYSEAMVMENPNSRYPFAPKNWRVPYGEDYQSIIETLQENQIQLSTAKAFYPDWRGGILGFHHIYVGHRYVADPNIAWNVETTWYAIIKKNNSTKYEWDGVFAFDEKEESVGQHWWIWDDRCIPVRFVQNIQ